MKVRVTYELDIPACAYEEARQLVFDELVLTARGVHLACALDYEKILECAGTDIVDVKLLQEASKSERTWADILQNIKTVDFIICWAPLE